MEILPGALLQTIDSPADLKNLSRDRLHQLCDELRQYIIDVVSVHGGHFGASLGAVELTVTDACAGAHALKLAGTNHTAAAGRVTMFERPLDDIRENLHIVVRVGAEPLSRRDEVFVDDAQAAEAHITRIVVTVEGERVMAVKPACLRLTTFC